MARMEKSNYNAQDIEVLEGLEPVRKRPGMYIGGTEGPQGLHHLVREILDNSVDEAMNGHADQITVTLGADGETVTVEDNGRGIPVDLHPKFKKSALELVLTTLHAGGKFSDHNYVSAGGLHGVGASVVNALSDRLEAVICRDSFEWRQVFSRGKPLAKLEKGAKTRSHGTKITFHPDPQIFREVAFDGQRIERLVEEKAFLNRGLTLNFVDLMAKTAKTYCYQDGVKAYLQSLLDKHGTAALAGEIFSLERANGIKIEVSFCWTESSQERVLSYVNGIHTKEGGSHEDGFKGGIVKAVKNYILVHELMPKGLKVISEDIREGLVAVLSVNVPGAVSSLQFQGQTKDRLNNPEIMTPVESLVRTFENVLNANPKVAGVLVERVVLAAKARTAARIAAESVSRKIGVSHRLNLPGKLADCSATNPEKCEIFIVEGDSAGGSTKQGRDRATQAVLPLRGKILNSVAANESKLKENKELLDLVSALGCGLGEGINLSRLRYGKVIILTDADADGMHIASLLMAFFFRFMRSLVDAGHLYIALSPLYRIRIGSGPKQEEHWVYTDEEKEELLKTKTGRKLQITRFKGLGEMNPKALWETTLDPKERTLLRIVVDNEEQTGKLLDSLLGKESAERFRLIQEYAPKLALDL